MAIVESLKNFCQLYMPIWKSWQLYVLLVTSLACQVIIYFVGMLPSKLTKSLLDKDSETFGVVVAQSFLLLVLNAAAISMVKWLETKLYIAFRSKLTRSMLLLYFGKANYYTLSQSSIDNADQRVTMDIERFCRLSCGVISVVVILPFTLGWYIYKAVQVTGWLGPVSCFVFFVLGTLINHISLPFVVRESREVEKREGDYRWKHAKIREHSEAIAMIRGAETETRNTVQKADLLFHSQSRMANRAFLLDFSVTSFDYLGGILSYLCIAPLVFGGYYENLDSAELAEVISATAFVIIYLVNQFTRIFDQMRAIADIIATGQRVAEMSNFCKSSNENNCQFNSFYDSDTFTTSSDLTNRTSYVEAVGPQDFTVQIANLSINRPASMLKQNTKLVSNLSFSLKKSENLIITGKNGIGKTSFIRVCNGIWRKGGGDIKLPPKTMFLPQLPLLTNGSIKTQVAYPFDPQKFTDQDIKDALCNAQLPSFTSRLYEEETWESVLSVGEQQKLMLSRVFLHRPHLVFLDESTSALPEEDEETIYQTISDFQIQIISVAHRTNLRKFHHRFLELLPDCLYKFN